MAIHARAYSPIHKGLSMLPKDEQHKDANPHRTVYD